MTADELKQRLDQEEKRKIDIMSDHFPLTQEELEDVATKVNEIMGLKVKNIKVTKRGIAFLGEFGIPIADMTRIQTNGLYEMHYRDNAGKIIRRKEKERRLRIERRNRFISVLLVGGLSIGAISAGAGAVKDAKEARIAEQTRYEQRINDIYDAHESILIGYADYEYSQFDNMMKSNDYDKDGTMMDAIYHNYLMPVHSNAYNYAENSELYSAFSGTEMADQISSSLERERSEIRTSTIALQDRLGAGFEFYRSPYRNAIVDPNAKPGEVDFHEIKVYIPASDIPGLEIDYQNLPEDSIVVNGVLYVEDDYLLSHTVSTQKSK